MQLAKKNNIAGTLALASISLITQNTYASEPVASDDDWNIDTAVMYYGEQDRVQAVEAISNVQMAFGDTSLLDIKVVFDGLTGASASGAVAQDQAQTFTRPSGNGEYVVRAGATPLDDTFHDTRVQLSANWSETLSTQWKVNAGLYGSKEFDYMSLGGNAGIEHGFNKDNTTFALSGSYTFDTIDPISGRPVPLSQMALRADYDTEAAFQEAFNQTRHTASDDKQTADILFSVTQVLNTHWIFQANYGLSSVSGYLSDPYKILSQVDSNGTTQSYRYEHRPDSRLKHSFYVMTKGALDSGVVDFSYRYTTDDWDLSSHTLETHYRYYFGGHFYAQIHLRYYQQHAAHFYQPFLLASELLPEYASADYRIGDMSTYTFGLKFGQDLSDGHELSYRLEYYQQNPENNGTELIGQLQHHDLFPAVKAIIAQFSYSF